MDILADSGSSGVTDAGGSRGSRGGWPLSTLELGTSAAGSIGRDSSESALQIVSTVRRADPYYCIRSDYILSTCGPSRRGRAIAPPNKGDINSQPRKCSILIRYVIERPLRGNPLEPSAVLIALDWRRRQRRTRGETTGRRNALRITKRSVVLAEWEALGRSEKRKERGARGGVGRVWGEWGSGRKPNPIYARSPQSLPNNPSLPGLRAFGIFLPRPKPSWMLSMGRGAQWEERERVGRDWNPNLNMPTLPNLFQTSSHYSRFPRFR